MKTLVRASVLGLMVLLGVTLPAAAATVIIETAAPLADRSEESVKLALREAVEASIQSAMAMGIVGVRLESAVLHESRVVVRLRAFIGEQPEETALQDEDDADVVPGATQPDRFEPPPGRIQKTGGEIRL